MMILKRRLAALAPVIAALGLAASVPLASAAPTPNPDPVITGPSCPERYNGPTNLATGCPYWLMSYTVQYPGQTPFRCPVNSSVGTTAAAGADRCDVVAVAK
jgi:hypothetical protein